MVKRKFSKREKLIMYAAQFGRCALCGKELSSSFHGDHKNPFSKGGLTELENGQALCPTCNFKKGNNVMSEQWYGVELPNWFDPRKWQKECFDKFKHIVLSPNGKCNFLVEACPGAGKTYFIFALVYILKQAGLIDWVIYCVPGDHLRLQACEEATDFDLHLFGSTNTYAESDYDGEIITYNQLDASKSIYKQRVQSYRNVLVVGDEIHHLGDQKTWSKNFIFAFSECRYRLFTTGTPFRSDDNRILGDWITYNLRKDGYQECVPDYRYGYGHGLLDGVVRPVVFPNYDSDVKYYFGSDLFQQSLKEAESKNEMSRCLNTALMTDGNWIKETLKEANIKLNEIRKYTEHKNAAGLIVCKAERNDDGVKYAQQIAKTLKKITEEKSVLITCEDVESSNKIKQFAQGNDKAIKWIIAIRKVSEGVTIKRLRVCVYATNITTRMFFYQVMGRTTRVIGDYGDETSYMYIPCHERLVNYAEEVKKCVTHLLEPQDEDSISDRSQVDESLNGLETIPKLFLPVASDAELDSHIYDGQTISAERINAAAGFKQKNIAALASVSEAAIALCFEEGAKQEREKSVVTTSLQQSTSKTRLNNKIRSKRPRHLITNDLRKLSHELLKLLARAKIYERFNIQPYLTNIRTDNTTYEEYTKTIKELNRQCNKTDGIYEKNKATIKQLVGRIEKLIYRIQQHSTTNVQNQLKKYLSQWEKLKQEI